MALMDLRCPVPSDGAHRLAWLIGLAPDPAAKLAEIEAQIGVNTVERILFGTLVPCERMGAKIWAASRCTIDTRMFFRSTPLRWWHLPEGVKIPRPMKQAA
jgi:hypothetical protein